MLVDFINRRQDFQCLLLGSLGMSTRYICRKTGLTHCQIQYRLAKNGTKRIDYRNGENESASLVMAAASVSVARAIKRKLVGERKTA